LKKKKPKEETNKEAIIEELKKEIEALKQQVPEIVDKKTLISKPKSKPETKFKTESELNLDPESKTQPTTEEILEAIRRARSESELKYCIEQYCFATEKEKNDFIYNWNRRYLELIDTLIIQAKAVRDFENGLVGAFDHLLIYEDLAKNQENERQRIINDYNRRIAEARQQMEEEIGKAKAEAARWSGGLGYDSAAQGYIDSVRQDWERKIADLEADKQSALLRLEATGISQVASFCRNFVKNWNNTYTQNTNKLNEWIKTLEDLQKLMNESFYTELFSSDIKNTLSEWSNKLKTWVLAAYNDYQEQSNSIERTLNYYSSLYGSSGYNYQSKLDILNLQFKLEDISKSLDGINRTLQNWNYQIIPGY